jgi:hypothetical protein
MGGRHYYLVTSLPGLGDLGTVPPMTLGDLLERVAEARTAAAAVAVVVLGDDLMKRQAVLSGEAEQVEAVILTADQLHDRQPLPDVLVAPVREAEAGPVATVDAVWAAYFRHAAAVAGRVGSRFLARWVGYEVALRNAMAAARARALDLETAAYLVATDLAATDEDLSSVVAEWAAAPDPLAGLRVLDAARWDWLARHDAHFSFQDDELTAYAAKLVLLHRWQRLTAESNHPAVARTTS